jgi:hypothetical protein
MDDSSPAAPFFVGVKLYKFIFIILFFLISGTWAHAAAPVPATSSPETTKGYLVDQGIAKGLITFEYNSWFEKMIVKDIAAGTQQESQAEYTGFALNYEQNFYQSTWGWGFGAGIASGSVVGGDKAGTFQYFQARVPWTSGRIVPRVFYRWNNQTDLGVDVMTLYRTTSWPDAGAGRTVKTGSELVAGAFLDLRVRFNAKLELIQSFGMLYKDESIFWRFGVGYRL